MREVLFGNENERYFQKLYEDYYAPFCLYAKHFIKDQALREDIVSDVFVSLWQKRDELELKPETSLAFIKMCVRNNCLNHLKHQSYEDDYAENYKQTSSLYEQSPDTILNLDELYEQLCKGIEQLPEDYKTVFIKHFFEGKTRAEIAEEMKLSVKSIDRYKQKGILTLQQEFRKYIYIYIYIVISPLSN